MGLLSHSGSVYADTGGIVVAFRRAVCIQKTKKKKVLVTAARAYPIVGSGHSSFREENRRVIEVSDLKS